MSILTQASSSTSQTKSSSFPMIVKLIFIGLITQLIYTIYIVAFPIISNTQAGGPAADLEILMRDFRWFAPIYTLGIVLLYYLFWLALKYVSTVDEASKAPKSKDSLSPHMLKLIILGFGLLFGFTLTWLYPITANDLFRYVLRGRIWAVYGDSPMIVPPNAYPDDPYAAFAGEFGDWVSGYGPLWEIVVQGPLRLGAVDMIPGSMGLKFVVLISYLISCILIGWYAKLEKSSSITALMFFAWNPLVLIQGPGNGHNDLLFMMLLILGIIFWQKKIWWATVLLLTLSALAKAPAMLMIPLFGVILLREQPSWSQRIVKAIGAGLIGIVTAYLVYSALGPVNETLVGVSDMLTTRRGFAPASAVRMVLREVLPRGAEIPAESIPGAGLLQNSLPCSNPESGLGVRLVDQIMPCQIAENIPRTLGRNIFLLFYVWVLWRLWQNKLNLVTAGFLVYFSQLMMGRTFRIWYPLWMIPLAAFHLTPATFWRIFLFSFTSELSIINYFVVWRWWLRDLPWERLGLLTTAFYWPVM
ncbi:MAG: hypothetical protein AAF485_00625, partial [Chloroflexota bacterium]